MCYIFFHYTRCPISNKLLNRLEAFPAVTAGQGGVVMSASALDALHDVEARIMTYLTHCADGSTRLMEEHIEGPGGGAGAEQDTAFPFHQRFGETRGVAHHTINDAVEKQFHLPRNIAPITGGSHDDGISLLHHSQYTLRVVFSHHTLILGAANHTSHTRLDAKVVCPDNFYHHTIRLCLLLHDVEHLRQKSFSTWTAIDDE